MKRGGTVPRSAAEASALARSGNYDGASAIYAALLHENPDDAGTWQGYGHALKRAGRSDESLAAHRTAVTLNPTLGVSWWGIANLSTTPFDTADLEALLKALQRSDLTDENRTVLNYAAGKAFESLGEFHRSFEHYKEGARIKRAGLNYDPRVLSQIVRTVKSTFSQSAMAATQTPQTARSGPIFVVGLPRSGSTLVEQILCSHPSVEGLGEIPDLVNILNAPNGSSWDISARSTDRLRISYLSSVARRRKTSRPLFTDKTLVNFTSVGFILLSFPGTRIIDVRRYPMATCFSAYKHYFTSGQTFTYSLDDLGRCYRDYVELMAHFDRVSPGRVHRVYYEDLIGDAESEVRRMLDYCGIAYDPACLRFFENPRVAQTASSEQVKRPIFRDGLESWRNYEPWLSPLQNALGSVVDAYPDAPSDLR